MVDVKILKNVVGFKVKMVFVVRDFMVYNVFIKFIKCFILFNIWIFSSFCSCICKVFVEGIFIGCYKCGVLV